MITGERCQRERPSESTDDFDELWRQALPDDRDDRVTQLTVVRLGDTSRDRGVRVGVTTERHG
jgi:hypothetical protein